ncbi:MAG: hypothetical protein AAFR33_07380 [Pseudomonadota bacterium]
MPDPTPVPDPVPEPSPEPTPEPSKDWHADWSGEDDALAKLAGRFGGPKQMAEAFANTQKQLHDRNAVKIPGEQASEDDITAWNTALGVPETVEGYGDALTPEMPEGMEFDDANKAMLTALAEQAHKAGGVVASPETVKFMANAYGQVLQVQKQQMVEMAEAKQAEHAETLRKMWQQGHDMNLKMAKEGRDRFLGDAFNEVGGWMLLDGNGHPQGVVGDHPAFANAFMEAMRVSSEDPTFLLTNTGESLGVDGTRAEIDRIMALRGTDPKRYDELAKPGGKLHELRARLERIEGSQAA